MSGTTVKNLEDVRPGDTFLMARGWVTALNRPISFKHGRSTGAVPYVNLTVRDPEGALRSVTGLASTEVDVREGGLS
jgi:hypothetical protein